MAQYRRRIVDDLLDQVFHDLSAIALEGAKGVGKTATCTERATTVFSLNRREDLLVAAASHETVLDSPPPVFIDEWQLDPAIWDSVRSAVDDKPQGGRFLLVGSASPDPGVRIRSGAGRIVALAMRPMTIFERGISEPTVSVRELLSDREVPVAGRSSVSLPDYVDEILRSGFPGIRHLPERARNLQLDSYVQRIVDHELREQGIIVRRPAALRAWLQAYAAATSTDAAWATILNAATPGESDKPARETAGIYREHLARIFVLDPLEAWVPSFAPLKRLTKAPKHHLVDPALAARLVGVGKEGLLRGEGGLVQPATGTWLGALFESLVTQSVRVYAEASDARVGHLRTKSTEREIDLIIESSDRSVVAIEVKLSDTVTGADVKHLNWLAEELGERVVNRLVVYTGSTAYRRKDGVAVVPLALLGP